MITLQASRNLEVALNDSDKLSSALYKPEVSFLLATEVKIKGLWLSFGIDGHV